MKLPDNIKRIISALEGAGHESYIVGGAVRDWLLGRTPSNYDIATAALPEQTEAVLKSLGLEIKAKEGKNDPIEVKGCEERIKLATFCREDGEYSADIYEDLARRDFSMNAVAYSPTRGIVDPFGGLDDVKAGLIRTAGDPRLDFHKNPIHMVRMARFCAQLGFSVAPETMHSALENKSAIEDLEPERLRDELFALVCGFAARRALLDCREIVFEIIPELRDCDGFEQHNPNHSFDVYRHICETVGACPRGLTLRLAALLHDVAKPHCFVLRDDGRGTFPGHMELGETMAREILTRLHCPAKMISSVCALVLCHDKPYCPTPAGARRWLSVLGRKNTLLLADLKRADCIAHSKRYHNRLPRIRSFRHEVSAALRRGDCYSLGTLNISGRVLGEQLGIKPGRDTGRMLHRLLDEVIDGNVPNERGELIALAKKIQSQSKEEDN